MQLEAGQLLFRQGDASDVVYLVEDGAVDVVRELADGATSHRATLGVGRYVGELGPLLGLQRSATAVAATACTLRVCSPQEFRSAVGTGGPVLGKSVAAADQPAAKRRARPLRATGRGR